MHPSRTHTTPLNSSSVHKCLRHIRFLVVAVLRCLVWHLSLRPSMAQAHTMWRKVQSPPSFVTLLTANGERVRLE